MNLPGKLNTNKEAHISNHSFDLPDVKWRIGDRVRAKDSVQELSSKGLAHPTTTLVLPTWFCSPSTKHLVTRPTRWLHLVHPW